MSPTSLSSAPSLSPAVLSPDTNSGKPLESSSSANPKTSFRTRKIRAMNYPKNVIFPKIITAKILSSFEPPALKPTHHDALPPPDTGASMNLSSDELLTSAQASTGTPSLSSSTSTTSSDSDLQEPYPWTDVCKPQQVVLYCSTSLKGCRFPRALSFYGPSLGKSSERREQTLPMIVLTPPDDEDDYCTVSPFILDLFCPYTLESVAHCQNLRVPTAPTSKGVEATSQRRKFPHPAGPWLRPQHTLHLRQRINRRHLAHSTPLANKRPTWRWNDGCRTAQGNVVGWEDTVPYFTKQHNSQNKINRAVSKYAQGHPTSGQTIMYPAVASFPPPRLPSEREIQQHQLQLTIQQGLRLGRRVHRTRQNRHINLHHKAAQPSVDLKKEA
ncbi:hypothetical protein VP01_2341g4 [Puccinia sorghi]|uniref:Uncharacterized protein n=1 Tax=Puccinia sorghi TaxID=27349 RepID=A0A0L6V825_9BASI|nr:hypothetical protein VP01_2341g4 [Puccinia sorghi]